ncbi:maleylpyruvate isomerase family mycothiol-dependent enzyme [Nakamurella sp. GG22]
MDDDDVWRAIDAQRIGLAEIMDGLSEQEWRHPSLCEGWTVRDVAAHLTMQQIGLGDLLRQTPLVVAARGSLNRVIHDAACRRAAQPTGPSWVRSAEWSGPAGTTSG